MYRVNPGNDAGNYWTTALFLIFLWISIVCALRHSKRTGTCCRKFVRIFIDIASKKADHNISSKHAHTTRMLPVSHGHLLFGSWLCLGIWWRMCRRFTGHWRVQIAEVESCRSVGRRIEPLEGLSNTNCL